MRKLMATIFIMLVVELFFLYFQINEWQRGWLGRGLFVLFILLAGYLWEKAFKKIFFINAKGFSLTVLGWFASFVLLGFVSSVFTVYYRLTPSMIWWSYFITAFLSVAVYLIAQKSKTGQVESLEHNGEGNVLFKTRFFLILLYAVLWVVGLYLLIISGSNETLWSPWQAIDKFYLPVFLFLTFLLGILLFSKFRTKGLLLIIILHSLLAHLYLPLSHELPWGGDVWRHLAVEKQLAAGEYRLPVLFGPEVAQRQILGVNVPEVFLIPHKYTYGNFWGTSVVLSETLRVDLLAVNKWLMPILWPLILPILLFYLGRILFQSPRRGLWFAGLSIIPFPLQALGGLTLPNSLGFLIFLMVLMLWLRYLQTGVKAQKWIAVGLGLLMGFGYALYFLLIWLTIISSWIVKKIFNLQSSAVSIQYSVVRPGHRVFSIVLKTVVVFISILAIPAIEFISKISFVPRQLNLITNAKQLVGQFSGWFYASAIRPHNILSGNILFNHTPDYAFVSSLFTDWRWIVIPVMIIIWILVFVGLARVKNLVWGTMALLFTAVFGGYAIGWFVLDGDRLFTRRLDAVLAFLILIFAIDGICYMLHVTCYKRKIFNLQSSIFSSFKKSLILISILILSWFTTITYASGPDMRVVSVDEYSAAQYIWNNEDHNQKNYCVLGDTWVLLALEGVSGGKIVGGGFTIDYQFAQTERVDLLNKIINEPKINILETAHEQTGAEQCWFIYTKNYLDEAAARNLGFDGSEEIGAISVWGEGLKKWSE
ncbi:MAG: hypothetical protein WC862_03165 [Patescibacteria group bacterium]